VSARGKCAEDIQTGDLLSGVPSSSQFAKGCPSPFSFLPEGRQELSLLTDENVENNLKQWLLGQPLVKYFWKTLM
jgi:hypothetical protein